MILNDTDIAILLDDFIDDYGYDFTQYSKASLKRRLERVAGMDKITDFSVFRSLIRSSADYFHRVVTEISVNVTEMFRDPDYFRTIKEIILPQLANQPLIRIWHAGVATGEEAYSMAILLEESGLLHKSLIYATDINTQVIRKAKEAVFPLVALQQYSRNYLQAGGQRDFSSYYTANYHMAQFDTRLTARMIFSTHNLVSDTSFNAFDLVFCRNVLIYFEKELQSKVLQLFDNSLLRNGYLVLGSKENIRFSDVAGHFMQLQAPMKIWRKIK